MSCVRKRGTGYGLRGMWTLRRLHRARNQFVGHCRGLAFDRNRWRKSRSPTAQRSQGEIQYCGVERRDRSQDMIRSGIGYDVHRLVEGRKLILGGIEIAHD